MTRRKTYFSIAAAAGLAALALLATACGFEQASRGVLAGPSPTNLDFLMGNWSSATAPLTMPSASSCTGFQWTVTSQQGNTVNGNFTATCPGGVQATGTASATITLPSATWNASGTATGLMSSSCQFTLSGTGLVQTTTIQVDYTGVVCGVPVSGTENLSKS